MTIRWQCCQLLAQICKPVQDIFLVCVFGPSLPPLSKKSISAFCAFFEYGIGCWLKTTDASKKGRSEIRKPYVQRPEFWFEDPVNILAVFRGVRETTRLVKPWSLLEGGDNGSRRRGGFGDCAVDTIPDFAVRFVCEDCSQERPYAGGIERFGGSRRY